VTFLFVSWQQPFTGTFRSRRRDHFTLSRQSRNQTG
jgi:hypothetical protein